MKLVGYARTHPTTGAMGAASSPIARAGGVVGQTALTGQSTVWLTCADSDYVAATPTTLSELAVPVKIGERVIAVINAESPN
ncbi:MAG: hypothetical protein IPO15_27345 [Anaerolineae bacterium]|uniref:hypothetical protein n=1 Tax=Candidatus Amarolinea dominans TaxID=3140696 RepID=UPI0031367BFA|nr:hypothetical protein [Anaerolineae bacterium]